MKAVVADPAGGPENLQSSICRSRSPAKAKCWSNLKHPASISSISTSAKAFTKLPKIRCGSAAKAPGRSRRWARASARTPGQRVAYAMARGSYAEYAPVPDSDACGLAGGRQLRARRRRDAAGHDRSLPDAFHVCSEAGDTCLIHAAAGRRRVC